MARVEPPSGGGSSGWLQAGDLQLSLGDWALSQASHALWKKQFENLRLWKNSKDLSYRFGAAHRLLKTVQSKRFWGFPSTRGVSGLTSLARAVALQLRYKVWLQSFCFLFTFLQIVWISLINVLEQVWITWYCSYPVPLRPQRREVLERPLVQAHPEFGSQNVSFKRRGCQHSPVRPLRPLQRREIPHQPQAAPTHFPAVGSSVFERSRQDWQEIETRWKETEIHYISSGSKSPKLSKPPLASEKGGGAVAYRVLVIVQSKLCIWNDVDVLDVLVRNCKLIGELGDLAQAKMRPHIRLSQVVGDSGDPENQREPEGSERDLFKTSERVWIPTNVYILLHCFHIAFVCISCLQHLCNCQRTELVLVVA